MKSLNQTKLETYMAGETHYTPIINILMSNRSKDWYGLLGLFIVEEGIPNFQIIDRGMDSLSFIAISFLTAVIDEKSLRNMFGEPIYHNNFGEGFIGEYDEEKDDYLEPEIKESFASYFEEIGEFQFHIGYDHRGTFIEIQKPSKFKWNGKISDELAEKCFESLKKLVLLYKEKNI